MIRSEQQENGDWHGFSGELPIARSKRPPRRSRSTGCGRSKAPNARGDGEAHRESYHMARPAAPRMALRLPTRVADSHLIERAQALPSLFGCVRTAKSET